MMPESLESFRLTKGGSEATKRKTRQQALVPAYKGWVLSFDQAIAHTGWVKMRGDERGYIVQATGHIKTEVGDRQGFSDTFRRVDEMEAEIAGVIDKWLGSGVLVYEMPAVFGKRTDSSLQAATVVRVLAKRAGVAMPMMVNGQQVKTRITGNPKADKAAIRAGVHRLVPGLGTMNLKPLNEHVYDAMAQAITVICEEDWSAWQ